MPYHIREQSYRLYMADELELFSFESKNNEYRQQNIIYSLEISFIPLDNASNYTCQTMHTKDTRPL